LFSLERKKKKSKKKKKKEKNRKKKILSRVEENGKLPLKFFFFF